MLAAMRNGRRHKKERLEISADAAIVAVICTLGIPLFDNDLPPVVPKSGGF